MENENLKSGIKTTIIGNEALYSTNERQLTVCCIQKFSFHPNSEAYKLPDGAKALVSGKDGTLSIGIWDKDKGLWYDEGSLIYSGGNDVITDPLDFSLI